MSITNFVTHSLDGNAHGVKSTLDDILKEKIAVALDTRKKEIASTFVSLDEKKMSNSAIAKKAHKGENIGHGGFKKVEKAAEKEYGSKEAGEKVAGAILWKKYGHKK